VGYVFVDGQKVSGLLFPVDTSFSGRPGPREGGSGRPGNPTPLVSSGNHVARLRLASGAFFFAEKKNVCLPLAVFREVEVGLGSFVF